MRVIGTAGHVDHGKSTLIAALTGVHPDRLKEEKEREMTIDLGFGWLSLPGGREVGIVDVPGHRDFVENMLAGVAGMDAVWLVVAADEGVMPQTREHLAILDLLGIRAGLLVMTKTDVVSDADRLGAVEIAMRAAVRSTSLEKAPIIRVSALTGAGLPELLSSTAALLDEVPDRPNLRRPRLALDRVFSLEGFGTVVTGTLADGELAIGDEVQFLPSGQGGRVRGLQNHKRQVERALPGARTAVNVTGVPAEALRRGDVLTHPGQYAATQRIDAHVRLLPAASANLTHGREIKFFTGTSETMARGRLLGVDQLRPGEDGWIQFDLKDPVVCARGDAFIARIPSPPETVGGGSIIDPHPVDRHKRHDEAVLSRLQALAAAAPRDLLLVAALSLGPAPAREVVERSRLTTEAAGSALAELLAASALVVLESGSVSPSAETLVVSARNLESITQQMEAALEAFHGKFPLRQGMPREELRNHLGLGARPFQAILAHLETGGGVATRAGLIALRSQETRLSPSEALAVDTLMKRFDASPNAPPSVKECIQALGPDLYAAMLAQGVLLQVSAQVVFSNAGFEAMLRRLRAELGPNGAFTLADVRDLFETSRRFAQAFLEYLDLKGLTRRTGDTRLLEPDAVGREARAKSRRH